MQAKVREARDQMAEISQEVRISFDEVEAFQARIIEGSVVDAFARLGAEFMLRRAPLEEQLSTVGDAAPLMAMIPQQIIGEDHVVATVGGVEDDPYGRLLRQAHFNLSMNTPWLGWARSPTDSGSRSRASMSRSTRSSFGLASRGGLRDGGRPKAVIAATIIARAKCSKKARGGGSLSRRLRRISWANAWTAGSCRHRPSA